MYEFTNKFDNFYCENCMNLTKFYIKKLDPDLTTLNIFKTDRIDS
jgi:hypothetical protein